MVARVVVGVSTLGRQLVRSLATWPGQLYVVTDDDRTAETFREVGIAATAVHRLEPDVLASVVADPDVAIVTADGAEEVDERLAVTRRAYPEARIAVVGRSPSPRRAQLADQVIDADELASRGLSERVIDPGFERTLRLLRTLRSLADPVAIVMHDNPDPDAIGAAIGVEALARSVGRSATPYYGGEITHQENRAFVNVLELELVRLDDPELGEVGGIVLVDHAHPGVNDRLDPETPIDIVIDHHPSREEAEATFVDRRHDAGATSTLVADHLLRADIELTPRLATALWYGIQIDTAGFHRGVSTLDFTTAAHLRTAVDTELLETIESPSVTAETLETIAAAIDNRVVEDAVLVSDVGSIHDRDALAQAADDLLQMAGIDTVCILGSLDGTIYASARTRDPTLDLGDAIRIAYGQIGNAGGHEDMAGAQIPIGILQDEGAGEVVEHGRTVITERFFEAIDLAGRPLVSGYVPDETVE